MGRKDAINRILCAVLVVAMLVGAGFAVKMRTRIAPENPLRQTAHVLSPDLPDGGGSADQQSAELPPDEPPEEEPPEEEPPEEEPPQPEEPPEETEEPKEPEESEEQEEPETLTEPEERGQEEQETGPAETGGSEGPDTSEEPGDGAGPGENGEEPGPGSGEEPGDDPGGEPGDVGPDEPETPPAPAEDDVAIATDLPNGVVTQVELPDGILRFYAYGVGADDLSVRVQVRNTNGSTGTWLESTDGRNWSFAMELGERYQFTLYLDRPGHPTQYTTRYVKYQAVLADEDNPEVGEYPPFITTNIDHYADGDEIEGENLALIVTVRSNPDYKVITADRIAVTLNGVPVDKHGGDANPEYDLYFEPPNVGDYQDYKIEIVAWYGNNSSYWSKTLRYHALADGDNAGNVTIVLDATTVGVGILDEAEYEIKKGDTAADVFLRFIEDYGYEITYDAAGNNFYIRRIYRGDMCWAAEIPEELWEAVVRDGINLNESQHDRDSLGEFDYTMGAGWMYAVDGIYPGRSMNRYEVKDGSTIYVRFTLSYGKDIGGFDSTGGGYGSYSSYCGLWINGYYTELEHDYVEDERVEPTETEDGYVDYTCSKCGKHYHEELPATGHDFVETDRLEPTETEDGYIEYTCTVCGETYREVLPATGHDFVETDRLEPTETEDGYIEYTCTICGEVYREILPATGSGEAPEPGGGDENPPPEEGREGDGS